ncbi:5-methyltetrahydropteroyltriglutamate--homocysteine S-methyltransferase [Blochmannia endosymbiont of Camponotus (Colobopsis) obliquus]|uniref:5-methyltetrahydropteroyltriglutamate-- homocysteine S-methyltransferase n=1 Tax=Blochmannia endosymbiont of Camponotus (Colobopsis) obliquus TaxID=1505597 RepID=UPI00061A74C5|nr:5-methyltetrahydropteroyltriglutamate--homocysteine S-methyltransferase [Blochmannia endosymbiont of Camponotus (Colobopsis) obliquus]AKC60765.1 5-methyltetrahydropteroyltriglutamate--homocysteine methyltransferase [Blochmannia endosymbiont of Camponotus (Colobopsis) obliquus]
MAILSHILGFPRIGLHRELKKALESYWTGKLNEQKLFAVGRQLRERHWQQQQDTGIDLLSVGDFAWYDHVLTTSLMVNNIPVRHRLCQEDDNIDFNMLFRIARGCNQDGKSIPASDMTKWFNTNYHYIVPELTYNQQFKLKWIQLLDEVDEALALGYKIKPILLGPLTYLWLGKVQGKKFNKLSLLKSLLSVYREILKKLADKGITWVQIDEPILVLELSNEWQEAFYNAYFELKDQVQILLTTYFDTIDHQINVIRELPVQGVHVDCTIKGSNLDLVNKKIPSCWLLSAGIINGRNIWRSDLYSCFKKLSVLVKDRIIWLGSSCSLLHSPVDLCTENNLDEKIKNCFSFSVQKCMELAMLCTALNKIDNIEFQDILKHYSSLNDLQLNSHFVHDKCLAKRLEKMIAVEFCSQRSSYKIRSKIQQKYLKLPILPTTTIGSLPQTEGIRKIRLDFKSGNMDIIQYESNIKQYIKEAVIEQENLDLDVLVHGEIERNDMVEYFAERLSGFVFTQNGWVQSYGSRCVKPPIIIGDISRKNNECMIVKWISYAQSITNKPVKGILTGPITILHWSFVREDVSRKNIALQISLAIRDEVSDLENCGISIIQIDEPALREGLPLKKSCWSEYLSWATKVFRICISGVKDETQIHTHMCYSKFNDIIDAIVALDVDVITIESSRSNMELLEVFKKSDYFNEIGPGIYDIHSPHVPSEECFIHRLHKMLNYISIERLWVNPDCGLKTRSWLEVRESLRNMVLAAKKIRGSFIKKY